tara:strand:- start:571 stop:1407 length:837 start_codon:yes stop_codon:yes gene_type:complete
MNLLIVNNDCFHYEIIESIIIHYDKILSIDKNEISRIILKISSNDSFTEYLKNKYPKIIINKNMYFGVKYLINVSIYKRDYHLIDKMENSYYISHEVDEDLKKHCNVIFTTPLCKTDKYMYFTELPFKNEKQNSENPIFIIQGELKRRNWNLVKKILERKYDTDFKIKIVGKGEIPEVLEDLLHTYRDNLILKQNLNFQDYHREFLDCYGIIPLISKEENASYYENKLTSSINYGLAYDLWFLIDNDLHKIYNLKKSKTYTNNIDDIFESLLKNFYKN